MAGPSRVVIVGKFFLPSLESMAMYMGDLAHDLLEQGTEVHVVAEREAKSYDGPVLVKYVPSPLRGRRALWARGFDSLAFAALSAWHVWRSATRGGVVMAVSTPPLSAFTAYPAARLKGAAFVSLEYDIYPEIVTAVADLPRPIERTWRLARDLVRRRADAVVVPSLGMARRVRETTPGTRVEVIPNWADEAIRPVPRSQNPLARELGIGRDDLVVLYSGNFGRAHIKPLLTLIAAAALVRDEGVRWIIAGTGTGEPTIRRAVEEAQVVTLLPRQPTERYPALLALGDIGVIAVEQAAEDLVYPSKLYGILAAGAACLVLSNSARDLAADIEGVGWVIGEDNVAGVSNLIERLRAEPATVRQRRLLARKAYEQRYGRTESVQRYRRLFSEVAPRK